MILLLLLLVILVFVAVHVLLLHVTAIFVLILHHLNFDLNFKTSLLKKYNLLGFWGFGGQYH